MTTMSAGDRAGKPPAAQLKFDELGTPLREVTFVVFDLETTGGSAGEDAVTEIGAVKVRGGEVIGEFATLVDPQRGIPPQVVALTGITELMVASAPPMTEVLPAFLEFAAGSVLVAHNSGFDIGFMKAACKRHGYRWPRPPVVCTVKLARRVLSEDEAPSAKLSALAVLFRAATQPNHRALADARATVDVLHGLLERVGGVGVQSLEELLDYVPEVTTAQRRKRNMASHLPHEPGVYLFRGPSEEVLYVGTATDLRRRVRQYFTASETRPRLREMVGLATRVDYVTCAHPLEAQVRELRLIAAHKPAYNRRSRNRHPDWWAVLTDEAFPRLSVVRTPRDGALGPFRSSAAAKAAVEAIQDNIRIRPCTQRIPARDPRGTPCALAEIGRCKAPCAGRQSVEDYAPAVDAVRDLVAGRDSSALVSATHALADLAAQQRFETASMRRDRLVTLVRALERGQRLAALASVPELVAAQLNARGNGWDLAVIRYGRLASAGVVRRGVPAQPVVDVLVAAAETVLPGDGPLFGAAPEETALLSRWLGQPNTRLGRVATPWVEPAGSAAVLAAWAEQATAAQSAHIPPDERR
ncbi:MAG TPA: DEDD exonuclease domain-containing protein [Pseudonocardiaceae bacterium]|jgi:DNA polymerase-3 subunit epsilon|nr:DEDD exonuclease domain-containing protein [Pseudonocardiaceae bacterium]